MDPRKLIFDYRSYTPIPLLVVVLILAQPSGWSLILGISLAIVGELLRLWAVAHAGSATRTTAGAGGDELVMTGPYAHLRNPLYLGNFFMTTGLGVAAWAWMPWMLLIIFLLFAVQYGMIVSLEEEYLRSKFAQLYAQYCHNVPRYLPRLKPFRSGQERLPSLNKALRSERSTLASFVLVSLLIFLRWRIWG